MRNGCAGISLDICRPNKVNKALGLFDVIQTLDSAKLARTISNRVEKTMPVLIEINSGREPQKTGVLPEDTERVIRDIALLEKISIKGLMSMGPRFGDPADAPFLLPGNKTTF